MILYQKTTAVYTLFSVLFLLTASFALAAAPPPKEKDAEEVDGEGIMPFKVTSPAVRNSFPPEIIDRMRKELMVLMGVEPEETEEPEKAPKTGH